MNLISRGQLPPLVEPVCSNASLTALQKLKEGVCLIAVVEILRRFAVKSIAKQRQLELDELFSSKQLSEEVKSGA